MLKIISDTYQLKDNDLILDATDREYVLRVKDLPSEERPREKLVKYGPDVLSEAELLAIVLSVGTKKEEVFSMSSRLLKEYGRNSIISHTNPVKFGEDLKIPLTKACQVIACFELGRRFFKKTNGKITIIKTAKQAHEHLKDMGSLQKEYLRGIYLNSRHHIVYDEVISIGSLTTNIVHPREVFRPALENNAVAVIIAHNHPSGDSKPTKEDIAITKQLIEAGEILGINMVDHLIITKTGFVSIPQYNM